MLAQVPNPHIVVVYLSKDVGLGSCSQVLAFVVKGDDFDLQYTVGFCSDVEGCLGFTFALFAEP